MSLKNDIKEYIRKGESDSKGLGLEIEHFVINDEGIQIGFHEVSSLIDSQHHREDKPGCLLYDGDYMYVHKNEPGTLYRTVSHGTAVFSTHPLDDQFWEEVPQNRLLVYRDGELIHEAQPHVNTYYHNEEKMRLQYLDHAML